MVATSIGGSCFELIPGYSAHSGRSGPTTPRRAEPEKLLYPFRRIHLSRVNVAFAVHAHLMQIVELASPPPTPSELTKLLQIASVQNVDGHIGVVPHIHAALGFIRGEIHGNRRANDVRVIADKLFSKETTCGGLASRIAARPAKRGIVLIEHLNAIIPPIADVKLAVARNLDAMHGVPEESRFSVAFRVVRNPGPGGLSGRVVNGIVSVSTEMTDIFSTVRVND